MRITGQHASPIPTLLTPTPTDPRHQILDARTIPKEGLHTHTHTHTNVYLYLYLYICTYAHMYMYMYMM